MHAERAELRLRFDSHLHVHSIDFGFAHVRVRRGRLIRLVVAVNLAVVPRDVSCRYGAIRRDLTKDRVIVVHEVRARGVRICVALADVAGGHARCNGRGILQLRVKHIARWLPLESEVQSVHKWLRLSRGIVRATRSSLPWRLDRAEVWELRLMQFNVHGTFRRLLLIDSNGFSILALRTWHPFFFHRLAESVDILRLLVRPRQILRALHQVLLEIRVVGPRLHRLARLRLDLHLVHEVLVSRKQQT